ncbi:MAG: carboxypeptidase-like regulatory domain-containing protein [Caldisericaceae bacterium]
MKKITILFVIIMLIGELLAGCGGIKPSTVTVAVVDENGNPIASTNLTMGKYSEKTGNDGKYVFKGVEAGNYTLKVTKEGYGDVSEDITVDKGEDKSLTITLRKLEQAEELKDYSALKSYKAVMELNAKDSSRNSKLVVEQENYGNSQHIIGYDENGNKQFEMYLVGDKAKVFTGGNWMELPATQVSSFTAEYLLTFETMVKEVEIRYNGWVKTPNGNTLYNVSKIGTETVNGYSTTNYNLSKEETSESGKTVITSDIWIINKGEYKNYMTRMVATSSISGEETDVLTINITDFGKDMGINMP